MQEVTNPEYSALIYVPRAKDLRLVFDLGLSVAEAGGFVFDVEPYGDADYRPASNVEVNQQRTSMSFDVLIDDRAESFRVRSTRACDAVLFDAVERIRAQGFEFRPDDKDRVDVLFRDGVLESLDIGRHEEGDAEDYITLILRDNHWFYVRGNPSQRIPVRQVAVSAGVLSCVSDDKVFRYELQSQPLIADLVGRLLSTAQGD
jgi:hypothetical protein